MFEFTTLECHKAKNITEDITTLLLSEVALTLKHEWPLQHLRWLIIMSFQKLQ